MIKKLSCVSHGSLKRFPHTFTTDNHIQEIPTFRDFTIRDPRYFVILFWALFHDFKEKKSKNFFFSDFFFFFFFSEFFFFFFSEIQKFFLDFLFKILIYSFLFVYSDCHLMNIKISLLEITITRNSLRM